MELAQIARALLNRLSKESLKALIHSNRGLLEMIDADTRRELRAKVRAALAEQGLEPAKVSGQVTARVVLRYLWLERPDLAFELSGASGLKWLEREVEAWKEVLFGDGAVAR